MDQLPTSELTHRLRQLEGDIKMAAQEREERNAAIASVIDGERMSRLQMQDQLDRLEVSTTSLTRSMRELAEMHRDVMIYLKGGIDEGSGLIHEHREDRRRITSLEEKELKRNSFMAGVGAVAGLFGALMGSGVVFLADFLHK